MLNLGSMALCCGVTFTWCSSSSRNTPGQWEPHPQGQLLTTALTRSFWITWPRTMHRVFQITQHMAVSVSGLHSKWKICKYALQNGLTFTPASISLLQPSFHYCILSTVCKTSFKDRKCTLFSFLLVTFTTGEVEVVRSFICTATSRHTNEAGGGGGPIIQPFPLTFNRVKKHSYFHASHSCIHYITFMSYTTNLV